MRLAKWPVEGLLQLSLRLNLGPIDLKFCNEVLMLVVVGMEVEEMCVRISFLQPIDMRPLPHDCVLEGVEAKKFLLELRPERALPR